jgi:hypothetical protein
MTPQPHPTPPAQQSAPDIERARRALDALASLIGEARDLHIVPADGLCALLDLIVRDMTPER